MGVTFPANTRTMLTRMTNGNTTGIIRVLNGRRKKVDLEIREDEGWA
jgi:hypothetical protein